MYAYLVGISTLCMVIHIYKAINLAEQADVQKESGSDYQASRLFTSALLQCCAMTCWGIVWMWSFAHA